MNFPGLGLPVFWSYHANRHSTSCNIMVSFQSNLFVGGARDFVVWVGSFTKQKHLWIPMMFFCVKALQLDWSKKNGEPSFEVILNFFEFALPKTNSSPLKIGHPRRKLVFQPSIFRGENVSFREGKTPKNLFAHSSAQTWQATSWDKAGHFIPSLHLTQSYAPMKRPGFSHFSDPAFIGVGEVGNGTLQPTNRETPTTTTAYYSRVFMTQRNSQSLRMNSKRW